MEDNNKTREVELDEIKNCINNINGVVDSIVLYEDNLYAFVINKSKIKDQDIIDKLTFNVKQRI